MGKKIRKALCDYGIMIIGCLVYAAAVDGLFVPNNIVLGGFTGLAQTLHFLIPSLAVGVIVIVLNVPLFILGIRFQGMKMLFSSLFCMVLSSVFIDVIPLVWQFEPMEDELVACIFGGALVGLSMGILLWIGSSTGGVELAARLLKYKFKHIAIGKLVLAIDLCVILLYGVVFRDINNMLYSAIAMYVSSVTMDALIYGRKTAKIACIICDHGEEMCEKLNDLHLGVTKIRAEGGYKNESKSVLICTFKPNKISALKTAVIAIDPCAFVTVCEAQDVFGEGFAECRLDSL